MTEIAIHGGGYAGLTASVHFALAGWSVLVSDPDPVVCAGINARQPKAGEFLAYVDAAEAFERIRATRNVEETWGRPVHVLAVPTEVAGAPYPDITLGLLGRIVAEGMRPGLTVIVESTLTPGTLDRFLETLAPEVRQALGSGWFLGHAPRRDWFADPAKNLRTLERVVGGVTEACTARVVDVVSHVSDRIHVTSYRTAEITKPLENALLAVPAMFAQELALAYPNADVAEALRLAGTHWRLFPLYLNVGLGGRCVPLGPKYLIAGTTSPMPIAREAVELNEDMRTMAASLLARLAGGGGSVAVLGLAYRPECRDLGSSPGLDVARQLVAKLGPSRVWADDPMFSPEEVGGLVPGAGHLARYDAPRSRADLMALSDVVFLATPHAAYRDLPSDAAAWRAGQVVLDAQGAWAGSAAAALERRGVAYRQVGKPGWARP